MAWQPQGPIGTAGQPQVDWGTLWRGESSPPGPLCGDRHTRQQDELTPIAAYMADEMNTNGSGADVERLRQLNAFSLDACIADYTNQPLWQRLLGLGIDARQCVAMQLSYRTAALLIWAAKVRQDGDWDHKPAVAARFNLCNPGGSQHWHRHGDRLYFYDVWSNLHYGYVGAAAGFSDAILLDGAGLEQIGSTLLRLQRPGRSPDVAGLRAWDDPHDRAAITLGIGLYRRAPQQVDAQDLLDLVVSSPDILSKPYP